MASRQTVLLTNALHEEALEILREQARVVIAPDTSASTLRTLVRDAEGIIVRAQLPSDILDHAPVLKGLVRHGVGVDFIPVAAATDRGIPVANLPGINTQAVAEYVFTALLQMRRPLSRADEVLRTEGWNVARAIGDSAIESGGTALGILGGGAIGSRIAEMAVRGFGMRVMLHSRRGTTLGGLVQAVDLPVLFAESDVVVVACALTDQTRGLVDAALIARMPRHAVLINIARGPVVETAALVEALAKGGIAGAVLDVFDVQPLSTDHPLFAAPNLLLTPHMAGITAKSGRAASLGSVAEMLRILRGEEPLNLVNPDHRRTRAR